MRASGGVSRSALTATAVLILVLSACSGDSRDLGSATSTVMAQVPRRSELEGPRSSEWARDGARPDVAGQGPLERPSVAIGWLEQSRLIAVDLDDLQSKARLKRVGKFRAERVSPIVGAPVATVRVNRSLVIASTDQAELVRLAPDWRHLQTLAIADRLDVPPGVPIRYGTLVLRGRTILAPVAYGSKFALIEVDLSSWSVSRHRVFADRFSDPSACLLDDGSLAVLNRARDSSKVVIDIVNPKNLARRNTITLPGDPVNIACVKDSVWAADFQRPRGYVVTRTGRHVGTFEWRGDGAGVGDLIFSRAHQRVYGADTSANVVYSCGIHSRRCKTSQPIGSKPTSLLTIGNDLFVAAELSQQIWVLDAGTLRREGSVTLPGSPRTLTLAS